MESVRRCFDNHSVDGQNYKSHSASASYGNLLDLDELYKFSSDNNLVVVEDAAGAFCSRLNGNMVGSTGDAATFSFNGNKSLNLWRRRYGGYRRPNDLKRILLYRSNSAGVYDYQVPGYNHQMLNTAAGIGLAQLDRIEEMLSKRKIFTKGIEMKFLQLMACSLLNWFTMMSSQIIGCFGYYLKMLMLQTTSLNSLKICRLNPGYSGNLSHFLPRSKCWPNMTCNIVNLYHLEW